MLETRLTLQAVLQERGKTRYWLAKQTGVNYETVSNYYANKIARYDGYVLAKFCEVLECDISDLLTLVEVE